MGSLSSGPKAPAAPQIVYYAPAPTAAQTQTSPQAAPQQSAEEAAAQERAQNLLARSRSRYGTVLTSFRGFLGEKENTATRKTLLGE